MSKTARVNVRSVVNNKTIRKERRHGRDVIVVPSATLPDNIVMNGIRYPAEEIAKSFHTLEGTPAPLGHPNIDGEFVSATDPRGIIAGFVGAYNTNVRRENGRVFVDKVIDVEYAQQLRGGRVVLEAIEKGEAIHTSTGLYCIVEDLANDEEATGVARDIVFDHDAILIGETGAATPEQGVGMLVNSSALTRDGKKADIVLNSLLEDAERELDWAAEYAARAAEKIDRVPVIERIKRAILEAIRGSDGAPLNNEEENAMPVTDEQFKALSDEVKALSDGMKDIGTTIANAVADAVKPITENLAQIQNTQKAKDDAELAELRNSIVKANLMDEATAAELTLNAARALAQKAKPAHALGLANGAISTNSETGGYKLPSAE